MEASDAEEARSVSSRESNDSICFCCRGGGEVVCCEGCPNSFHVGCLDTARRPQLTEEEWFCPECVARSAESKGDLASAFFSGVLPSPGSSRFRPPSPLYPAKDANFKDSQSSLRAKKRSLRASQLLASEASSSSLATAGGELREKATEEREGAREAQRGERGEQTAEVEERGEQRAEREAREEREEREETETERAVKNEGGEAAKEDPFREPANAAASLGKLEVSSETENGGSQPVLDSRHRRMPEQENEEKGDRRMQSALLNCEKENDREDRDKREGDAGADGEASRGRPCSVSSSPSTAASSRDLCPPLSSHPSLSSSSLSSSSLSSSLSSSFSSSSLSSSSLSSSSSPSSSSPSSSLSSSSSSSLSSSSLSSSSLSSASSSSLSSSSLSSSFHPSSCSSPQSSSPQPPSALPSSFHSPLSAFSSFASCRPGRWGNTAGGAGSSSKKRRRRGDETRINVGPDYQVPRLPEFYLSRTDETASAEEARCALFPFSPSLSACASLLVSSHASSSPFASQPSAASSFSFQERLYSQAAPCAAFRDAAQAEGLRGRSQAQTAGEEKKRFRAFPGCSLASPCGGYFLPPVFCSGDSAAALGAAGNFGAPPGSAFEDSRHSALEPRLVYSPRCLEEKRQQCLATGRMQHCIRTQGELADFVETCSRCWHARPGWQPFSAEFAYQLLHRAGYDPQRALRMLDDPGFCFNDICDPPLRKYDNKWKRRDKRGTFPNSPYPPPLVVQSFLQEKSRACRPSLSGTGSYAIR